MDTFECILMVMIDIFRQKPEQEAVAAVGEKMKQPILFMECCFSAFYFISIHP